MEPAPQANLTEIFSSIQGEGPDIGRRHLFVRFYGCHRRCVYCDSPETVTAMQPPGYRPGAFCVEDPPGSNQLRSESNPVTADILMALIEAWDEPRGVHHAVVATGGEPLLHAAFLGHWFPMVQARGLRTYLETAGDLYHELEKIIAVTDRVAMDIKLPSVTGNEAAWGQHRRFLKVCVNAGKQVFVKTVVSAATRDDELAEAGALVRDLAPSTPFILQPMSVFGDATNPPTPAQLLAWHRELSRMLEDVRVIPQAHKLMGAR